MDERRLLVHTWNETQQDYPAHLCIHNLFEQQVERTPQATALVFMGQSLSYADLNVSANRLAHHLIGLGVQPDMRVVICVERSFAMIVGVLAILKAGGAYVPLDPAYASERLRDILSDASSSIAVVDKSGRATLRESALALVTVVDPNAFMVDEQSHSVPVHLISNPHVAGLTSRHLAYVIYTSGSTGKPKGVLIEHQGAVNLIHSRPEMFGILPSSRILQFTSLSFDHSVSEIFSALSSGASLHIVQDDTRLDQHQLNKYLELNLITHVSLTPALLQNANLPALTTLTTLIVMGEALPAELLRNLKEVVHNGSIINSYGPTEITVSAITWRCPKSFKSDVVPIGRPLANKRVYILDKHRHPVPLRAIGELYIGGVGVARGYLHRQELTDKVFLHDPFADNPEARMYKTGDLARYHADGNIEFLGRNDHQVKIRGFRIELGEIEARLIGHTLVDKAVVIALGAGGDTRLVAYVVAKPDDQLVSALRSHLSACLPDYMVPAAVVRLDALPLTPNGKLDRKALPAPDSANAAFARKEYEEPQSEIEIAVAHIWSELLHLDRVSRNDNFFALGGHSLLAVRVMNRIAALNVQMPLSTLFASPSLSSFAECVHQRLVQGDSSLSMISPISREGDLPLSFAQQRLWFLAQMEGVSKTYHIPLAIRLCGKLNCEAWQRALDTVFARHEALRSVFVTVDGLPRVRLLSAQSGIPIRWKDLRGISDTEAQLERIMTDEVNAPFDLVRGPLIRALMVQLDSDEHLFSLTQHHIVSDGWSMVVLHGELNALYGAYCRGESDPLPPLAIQYPDYAAWQRQWLSGDRLETHSSYWRTTLADVSVLLNLPTDRPRPPQQSYSGDRLPIRLDPQLTRALKQLSQKHGMTLYMTILAAWSAVLSRLSGQDDIVIGSPAANRNHYQIESLIGFFVNTLALRVDMSGDPTVGQLLGRVRSSALGAQAHQDLPFEQVVDIVQPPRSLSHSPLFQVMFVWQNNEAPELHLPAIEAIEVDPSYDIAKLDITLQLYELNDTIAGSLEYSTALFDRQTMERQIGYLISMLQAMTADQDQTMSTVDLLGPAERNLLFQTWNETRQDYPTHLCIHNLFEQQVERTPHGIALVYPDQSLSYSELNYRANRLAHHLINLGVQPDMPVAICVERSFAMIVGVLGILKAGGAYVPLDPSYASERLRDILTDTAASIAVIDKSGRAALGEAVLASVTVVDPNALWDAEHESTSVGPVHLVSNPHVSGLTSSHLAYVIYTSGSTGKPKGVMIEHQGVVNLVMSRPHAYGSTFTGNVLQFPSFSFDSSVVDIFTTLSLGGTLHVLEEHVRLDRMRLWNYIEQHSITQALLPPAILQDCTDLPHLTTPLVLIVAGDALSATLIQTLQLLIPNGRIVNDYGPTEATVSSTTWKCPKLYNGDIVPIGRPIANKRIYILDMEGQPVPLGAEGELYIGGIGVARGYLNRPELTAKVFLQDPFTGDPDARMYKTGDLARYLPDGNIVFLGRNDHQVKIRGFRIELGEIEARLMDHTHVDKAAVIAIGEGNGKRLVAYVVAKPDDQLVSTLRSHLSSCLPEYMIPAAIVRLDDLPLSSNGKLDRKALPAPDSDAFARQEYEEPQGEIETAVAHIWSELLHLDRVSRNDNFFALGGHSLLAVRMVERLRGFGLAIPISHLFKSPTLRVLAQSIHRHHEQVTPANLVALNTTTITPDMLPLIDLTQTEIDLIVKQIPGGVANVQDIYSLSPLQEGILFHHLLASKGDPYLLITCMAFATRELLDRYLDAVQQVVNRQDMLRTAFAWESLSTPAQVVWCQAPLSVTELHLDLADGPIADQLMQRFDTRQHRIDLTQAPLLKFTIARDSDGRWILAKRLHHLIGDHSTLEIMNIEITAFMEGRSEMLPTPQPFRNLISQVRFGRSQEDHEKFFTEMLSDIDKPSLPFGLTNVHGQGDDVTTAYLSLPQDLNDRLRLQAKQMGVSVASLCHLAWAQVISCTSGEDQVVFGTVLFGRMHSGPGASCTMGLFINTLPLRVDLNESINESVLRTHARLASLLEHEHASLVLAQRCSNVPQGTPLFNSILNYRHNSLSLEESSDNVDIEYLQTDERTNYPLTLSVEDFGSELGLTVDVVRPFDPERICGYMQQTLQSLAEALDHTPNMLAHQLEVLPLEERKLLLQTWNSTQQDYPRQQCIHHLFEQQVNRSPEATAL
ncbi:hypothetical protein BGZ65_002028, partial [Modicella reniformis]